MLFINKFTWVFPSFFYQKFFGSARWVQHQILLSINVPFCYKIGFSRTGVFPLLLPLFGKNFSKVPFKVKLISFSFSME